MLRMLKIQCFEIVRSILFESYVRIFMAGASREFVCYIFYVSVVHIIKHLSL